MLFLPFLDRQTVIYTISAFPSEKCLNFLLVRFCFYLSRTVRQPVISIPAHCSFVLIRWCTRWFYMFVISPVHDGAQYDVVTLPVCACQFVSTFKAERIDVWSQNLVQRLTMMISQTSLIVKVKGHQVKKKVISKVFLFE